MVGSAAADVALVPLAGCSRDEGGSRLAELCAVLLAENDQLRGEVERLGGRCERLRARVRKLEGMVEELRRAAKRQAAPFSHGKRKEKRGRPGRSPGAAYGKKARRLAPEEVDETVEAPTRDVCECGGGIEFERVELKWQEELPEPKPIRRCIKVHFGGCRCCGKRNQGRHPVSDLRCVGGGLVDDRRARDCAGDGAEQGAGALATEDLKGARAVRYRDHCGRGGAGDRQAGPGLEPTYGALVRAVRSSTVVAPDETGWRVDASTLEGELCHAGSRELRAHLALLIANDKQPLGNHAPHHQRPR